MSRSFNIDEYLERIQWGGETRPTLDTLNGLLGAHMSSIPFENLDILLGRPVRLDLKSIQDKLVRSCRGGYCFEHGTLFAAALEAFGFKPVRHVARVVLFAPRTAAPRTHMFLTVPLAEGTFVVDPGFGGLAPRIPVPVMEGAEARADYESHWLVRDDGYWMLRAQTGDKVVDCWVSMLEQENPVDFDMGNYYTATHSSSVMVNRLLMRALTKDGRVTVMNRDLTIWRENKPHLTQLVDRAALRQILVEYFGFDLPDVEQIRVPSIPEWE